MSDGGHHIAPGSTLFDALSATQAANVESRIAAIENLGQHGALPDYWRKPLALAFAADEVAATELLAVNDALAAQAKWRSEPEVARVMDELDDWISMVGQAYTHSKERMPADLLKVCQLATSVTTRMRSHYRITSARAE